MYGCIQGQNPTDPDWAWLSDPVPGSPSGVGVKLLRSAFRVTSDQCSRREEQSPRDGHGYHSVLVQLGLKAKTWIRHLSPMAGQCPSWGAERQLWGNDHDGSGVSLPWPWRRGAGPRGYPSHLQQQVISGEGGRGVRAGLKAGSS